MAISSNGSGFFLRTASVPQPSGLSWGVWVLRTSLSSGYQSLFEISSAGDAHYIDLAADPEDTEVRIYTTGGGSNDQVVLTLALNTWVYLAYRQLTTTTAQVHHRTGGASAFTSPAAYTTPNQTWANERLLTSSAAEIAGDFQIAAFKQWSALLSEAELWEESHRLEPVRRANLDCWLPGLAADGKDHSGNARDFSVSGSPVISAAFPPIFRVPGPRPVVRLASAPAYQPLRKDVVFRSPPQLAISEGSSSPNPGLPGVQIWSTTASRLLAWNGSEWRGIGSSSLPTNTVVDGATSPNPGVVGSVAWSTALGAMVVWDGTAWWSVLTRKFEQEAVTGTSYTAVLADNGKHKRCTNASPVTFTVPNNSSVAFPVNGTQFSIEQGSTGQVTIAGADENVIIESAATLKTRTEGSVVTLMKTGLNTWLLTGDMAFE